MRVWLVGTMERRRPGNPVEGLPRQMAEVIREAY